MPDHKLKIYKLADLEKLTNNDDILAIARSLGLDTSPFTTQIKGQDVLWTLDKRKDLIRKILDKNPSLSEIKTRKLQKLTWIYFIWAMIATFLTLLLSLYRVIDEKDTTNKLYLNGSFVEVISSEQQLDPKVFTLFDVSGLTFGPLTMGENIRLRGIIVDTNENFYTVDFSNSIQGLDKPFYRLAKDRKIENKIGSESTKTNK